MEISVFDKCWDCYGEGVRGTEIGKVEDCSSCKGTGKVPSGFGEEVLKLIQLFGKEQP